VIGNLRLMQNEGIDISALQATIAALQAAGKTAMIVAARPDEGCEPVRVLGVVAVADTIKQESPQAMADLRLLGLDAIMITGDNRRTADAIALQVGVNRVLAEVLPGDKAAEVKRLQASGGDPGGDPTEGAVTAPQLVAMVGDGINDAPALAQSDVGIAIGTGTDVAMAAAGITLISGDLRGVGRAISLSRGTLQTIVQNLFWAFSYNVILIPVAVMGLLMPMIAAGAMAFSSIFVVTNSLRLRGYKVEVLAAPKSLGRQVVAMAPRLAVAAIALALLMAVSLGGLRPAGAKAGMPSESGMAGPVSYRAVVQPTEPIVPGQPAILDIYIVDKAGRPFNDFATSNTAGNILVTAVRRDLVDYVAASVEANLGTGGGGGMMGGGAPAPTAWPGKGQIQPLVAFPSEGAYVVFVDFWPAEGDQIRLSAPLSVGASGWPKAETASLTPDATPTQRTGDLSVTMKTSGPLRARRDLTLAFEAVDDKGRQWADGIQAISQNVLQLVIVDEKLTRLIRPDIVNRHRLEFATSFPKAGKYKAWLTFVYDGRPQELAYVFEVR